MEKPIDFDHFDYVASIDALLQYPLEKEFKKVVLRGNSIQVVRVEDNSNICPDSELQNALQRVVQEANVRMQSGVLPVAQQKLLKSSLTLLGKELHNDDIGKLATEILTPVQSLPIRVFSSAFSGLKGLGHKFGLFKGTFPLLGLDPEIRREHVFKFLNAKELVSLNKTSKALQEDVVESPVAKNTVLLAKAKAQLEEYRDTDILKRQSALYPAHMMLKAALLQSKMEDVDGAKKSREEARDLLLPGNRRPRDLASISLTQFKNKDIAGAELTLKDAVDKMQKQVGSNQVQFDDAEEVAKVQIALGKFDDAKKTISKMETLVVDFQEKAGNWNRLAQLQMQVGNVDAAKKTFRKAFSIFILFPTYETVLLDILKGKFAVNDGVTIDQLVDLVLKGVVSPSFLLKIVELKIEMGEKNDAKALIEIFTEHATFQQLKVQESTQGKVEDLLYLKDLCESFILQVACDKEEETEEKKKVLSRLPELEKVIQAALTWQFTSDYATQKDKLLLSLARLKSALLPIIDSESVKETFTTLERQTEDVRVWREIVKELVKIGEINGAKDLLHKILDPLTKIEKFKELKFFAEQLNDLEGIEYAIDKIHKLSIKDLKIEKFWLNHFFQIPLKLVEKHLANGDLPNAKRCATLITDNTIRITAELEIALYQANLTTQTKG